MKKTLKVLAVSCACLAIAGTGSIETQAAMNLETDAPVAGVSVAINNYYASSLHPEEELAEAFCGNTLLAGKTPSLEAETGSGKDTGAEGEDAVVVAASTSLDENVALSRVRT